MAAGLLFSMATSARILSAVYFSPNYVSGSTGMVFSDLSNMNKNN